MLCTPKTCRLITSSYFHVSQFIQVYTFLKHILVQTTKIVFTLYSVKLSFDKSFLLTRYAENFYQLFFQRPLITMHPFAMFYFKFYSSAMKIVPSEKKK